MQDYNQSKILEQIKNQFFQIPLKTRIIVGAIILITLVSILLVFGNDRNNNNQSKVNLATITPNSLQSSSISSAINQRTTTSTITNTNPNIPIGYPANLVKKKAFEIYPLNHLQDRRGEAIVNYDRNSQKLNIYKLKTSDNSLPYAATYNKNIFYISSKNIPKIEVENVQRTDDLVKENTYLAYGNNAVSAGIKNLPDSSNIIFYASVEDLTKIPRDINKKIDLLRGVYIYTTKENGLVVTKLKDTERNKDFVLANFECKQITFNATDFFCINFASQLINLTNNEAVQNDVFKINEDDNGNLYTVTNKNEVLKSNINNPSTTEKVYEAKKGEYIQNITHTNQNELLMFIQLTKDSERYSNALKAKDIAQVQNGYTGVQDNTRIKEYYTLELKPDKTTVERPEFEEYEVLL